MNNDTFDLEQLLTNQDEFKKKQEAYNMQLRQQVLNARRAILNHLNQKHQMVFDQAFLRRLSQAFYIDGYTLPKELGQPLFAIGSSPQDAMHHTHFIQACLLLHYLDEIPDTLPDNSHIRVSNICSEDPDTTTRLEEQWKVYYNLMLLITGNDQVSTVSLPMKTKRSEYLSIKTLYNKLLTLEKQMKQQTETLETLKTLVQEKRL